VRIIVPYAPGGTSPELVRRLYTEAVRGLGAADVRERLEKSGNEYVMSPPEEFVVFLRGEFAKWKMAAKEANLRIE
jgi:tripartite-type tricarboxylate transporter receptor subunit TctC